MLEGRYTYKKPVASYASNQVSSGPSNAICYCVNRSIRSSCEDSAANIQRNNKTYNEEYLTEFNADGCWWAGCEAGD